MCTSLYSTDTYIVQYTYFLYTVYVPPVYSTCTSCIQYMYFLYTGCTSCIQYMYFLYTVHVLSVYRMYLLYTVHVHPVHVLQYMYILYIHVQVLNEIQWTLAYPATTGPYHGQISEIARYVNHRANRVYNVSLLALPFLFLSGYPSSVQTIVVFRPFQAANGRNSGIFGCSNDLVQLLYSSLVPRPSTPRPVGKLEWHGGSGDETNFAPCTAWALNRMH